MTGFLRNPSQRGVTHRARLLVDFLQHEMLEAALFRHDRVPGDVLHLANDRLSVEVGELHALRRDHRQIAVAEEKQVAGVIQNRGNVGGDEILVLAQADYGGRAVAGGHDLVGLIHRDHRQRKHAGQLAHRFADALFERGAMSIRRLQKIFFHQVSDHFGVGLGGELVAFFDELALQRNVVLDNPVVHDHDSSGAVAMRVGVLFRGTAMCGPAGMTDAVGAIERLEPDHLFQIAQLALSPANLQPFAIAAHRDSGGIIAAILQPSEALDDDRYDPLLANVSHYAAHTDAPSFRPGGETEDVFCELESGHYFRTRTARSVDNQPAAAGKPSITEPGTSASLRGRNETLQSPDWSGRRGQCVLLLPRLRSGSGRHRV